MPWQKRPSEDSSRRNKTWLPRARDLSRPAFFRSLMCREQAGCESGNASTISIHGTSPLPARNRKMQIRAGWARAFAKAASLTEASSNASSFATGMNYIFQICDKSASGNFRRMFLAKEWVGMGGGVGEGRSRVRWCGRGSRRNWGRWDGRVGNFVGTNGE